MTPSAQVFDEALSISEQVHPSWSHEDRLRFARAAAQLGDRVQAGVFRPGNPRPMIRVYRGGTCVVWTGQGYFSSHEEFEGWNARYQDTWQARLSGFRSSFGTPIELR